MNKDYHLYVKLEVIAALTLVVQQLSFSIYDFVALAKSAKFKDMAGLSSMLQLVSLVVYVRFKETTALYSVLEPISLSIFRVVSLVNSVEFKEIVALYLMTHEHNIPGLIPGKHIFSQNLFSLHGINYANVALSGGDVALILGMHVCSYKACNGSIAAECMVFVKEEVEFMMIQKNMGGFLRLLTAFMYFFILKQEVIAVEFDGDGGLFFLMYSPIINIKWHKTLNIKRPKLITTDQHIVSIWDLETGDGMTSIEPTAGVINDMCVFGENRLILLALDTSQISSYFLPALGLAPKWCSSLETMTAHAAANPIVCKDYIKKRKQEKEEQERITRVTVVTDSGIESSKFSFNVDKFLDFSNEDPSNLEWVNSLACLTSENKAKALRHTRELKLSSKSEEKYDVLLSAYILQDSRFINYLEEQTDGEAMINSIKNGDQPLPRVTQVSIAGTTSTKQPPLKDKSMWSDQEKRVQNIDRLVRSLLIQRLPNDIYSLINRNKTSKDLWDALARHMLGSEYDE
nr:hypothetical protein [Tanacetum cinerariifolium]